MLVTAGGMIFEGSRCRRGRVSMGLGLGLGLEPQGRQQSVRLESLLREGGLGWGTMLVHRQQGRGPGLGCSNEIFISSTDWGRER